MTPDKYGNMVYSGIDACKTLPAPERIIGGFGKPVAVY